MNDVVSLKIPTIEALPTYKAIFDRFLIIISFSARRAASARMQKPSCPHFSWSGSSTQLLAILLLSGLGLEPAVVHTFRNAALDAVMKMLAAARIHLLESDNYE